MVDIEENSTHLPRDEDRCTSFTQARRRCRNRRDKGSPFCGIHNGRVAEQARIRAERLRELYGRIDPANSAARP